MSHIEIVNRFIRDGFFVVEAEHYNDDGSFWFSENYRWLNLEGNIRKRQANADGVPLLSDDTLAPRVTPSIGEIIEYYLPEGKAWKYRDGPHMDDSSIWEVVVQIHQERQAAEFVSGRDTLPPGTLEGLGSLEDQQTGGEALMTRFVDIAGDAVVL